MIKPLPIAVSQFAMTTLNNLPYTFGGKGGDSKTTVEQVPKYDNVYMFSFDINEWLDRARIPVYMVQHAVVAVDDDTALMCGGYNQLTLSPYRMCFMYKASTNGWAAYKWALNLPRSHHGMTTYNSRVYAYGGFNAMAKKVPSAEKLSESNGWQLIHDLATADAYFASVALTADVSCQYYCECKKNLSILCAGGINCECNLTAKARNNTGNHKAVDGNRQMANTSSNPLHGTLINSNYGTQVFDFDYYPYTTQNHNLGLHTSKNASKFGSRAVLIGNSAYFAGTDGSLDIYGE
jgi:hypothetical protein